MIRFTKVESLIVPLVRDNINTDAIIPSKEIRTVSKNGLADGLFAGWRYLDSDRTPDPSFVLNQPLYAGAEILGGGENFGCGSSREQAVWALAEYGFRVIIAPSFNSIFRRNCIRNGILPVQLDAGPVIAVPGPVTVDLEQRSVTASDGRQWSFAIEEEAATMLTLGLDEIEFTLKSRDKIDAFRDADRAERPWAYL